MINQLGQVMLYVEDQEGAVQFWTEKLGFHLVSQVDNGQGMKWFEIAPTPDVETSFILHNKELIAKMQPQLNLGTPSLMFFSDQLEELYSQLKAKNVTVGDLVDMPQGKVFNFADHEQNYFAVMEKK